MLLNCGAAKANTVLPIQECQEVLSSCKSRAFQDEISADLWKQKQKGNFHLAQRRSFDLALQSRVKDVRLDWQEQKQKQEVQRLPILVHKRGYSSQYARDGQRLLLLKDLERNGVEGLDRWLKDCMKRLRLVIVSIFVPQQVRSNYMHYLKWKCVHRIFSSALHVQATQAMLQAIGIGAKRSLPTAAALNWVLKDGLGRLSKFVFTASLGPAFDANLKRVRFSTSVLFSLGIGVEMLTPFFPQKFLLLATVANIAKSISMAAYVATSSAIHRSFSVADNLGDISAKSQIQTVCFDNIGLALAACLNLLCKNNPRYRQINKLGIFQRDRWNVLYFSKMKKKVVLDFHEGNNLTMTLFQIDRIAAVLPFVTYIFCSAMDLIAIYQGLRHVHLLTLNKARLEIIVEEWLHSRVVPSAAEVSNSEGIQFFTVSGSRPWPLRIGSVNPKDQKAEVLISIIQSLRNEDSYFLCMESCNLGLLRKPQMGLLLCLHERAQAADIIMGMLQASYLRVALISSENSLSLSTPLDCDEYFLNSRSKYSDVSVTLTPHGVLPGEWQILLEESKRYARVEVTPLLEQMEKVGWVVKHVLLSPTEQVTYSILGEHENLKL